MPTAWATPLSHPACLLEVRMRTSDLLCGTKSADHGHGSMQLGIYSDAARLERGVTAGWLHECGKLQASMRMRRETSTLETESTSI